MIRKWWEQPFEEKICLWFYDGVSIPQKNSKKIDKDRYRLKQWWNRVAVQNFILEQRAEGHLHSFLK